MICIPVSTNSLESKEENLLLKHKENKKQTESSFFSEPEVPALIMQTEQSVSKSSEKCLQVKAPHSSKFQIFLQDQVIPLPYREIIFRAGEAVKR